LGHQQQLPGRLWRQHHRRPGEWLCHRPRQQLQRLSAHRSGGQRRRCPRQRPARKPGR